MIDQELKDIIIYRIGIIVDTQSDRLIRENDRLRADAGPRGFPSMPGDTQAQITELYEEYYSNLPRLIIQEMRDVLLKAKIKPSVELSKYLKDIVSSHSINFNNFRDTLRLQNIDYAIAETVIISPPSRFFPEIDLIMKELENIIIGDEMKSKSHTTNYHINAPGGIIQTGNHSTANLITINQNHKDDILNALNKMKIKVNNVTELQLDLKEEVIDLIEETKFEVSKTQANTTRLKSFLNGIAKAIGACASLKPAYDTLKNVGFSCNVGWVLRTFMPCQAPARRRRHQKEGMSCDRTSG